VFLGVAAVVAFALAHAAAAGALTCPEIPFKERLAGADVAFVGRLVSERPARNGQRDYRFTVDQAVKGPIGREVEVRAARLVDLSDQPLQTDVAVGVLASTLDNGTLVTSSCALVDPASLLATADEPKGTWIKIGIGILILGAVLLYSFRRLRRRQAVEYPHAP
jgi:hypothetical protein